MIRNWGFILAAIWFILWGAISIFALSFNGLGIVMGILAIVAGILILLGK